MTLVVTHPRPVWFDVLRPITLGGVVRHIQDRGQDRSHNSRADAIPAGAVSTANESQVDRPGYVLASDPLSPFALGGVVRHLQDRGQDCSHNRRADAIPRGSGLDREREPSDRPSYALARDPLSPFALGDVVRHMQDRGQDRSHNSRADAIPVGAVSTANGSQVTVQAVR